MSALNFDKHELCNLEYSLEREMLATDRRGGYMSTTIVGCNTRKYHGLMVAPIDDSDRAYVLLSSLDETVIQHGQVFNLALHRFDGIYEPRGHKYITDFEYTPTPTITYRVGGVVLRKELLWIHKRTQLMIRYTLVDAHSDTTLRLRPFFAFRDKYALTHANMEANGRSYPVKLGVRNRLYEPFPWLYLQTTKVDAAFIPAPDWYYNFEYQKEIERGMDGHEDLLTTGYFEMNIHKGESVIFSASVEQMDSAEQISELYEQQISRRTHKVDFLSCMHHSARQFIIRRSGDRTEVIAGYPWWGIDARQTLISLPGLTLEQSHKEDCMAVLDTMLRKLDENGCFASDCSALNEVDAPLWLFWTLQNLEHHIGAESIWTLYGKQMKSILESYRRGMGDGEVAMHANGLVWAGADGRALTWANNFVDGKPVTPRYGYAVEVQALWYNAVRYALVLAAKFGDEEFVERWRNIPILTRTSFLELFALPEGYLADYVNLQEQNKYIRCNQIIACGLDYTMLSDEQTVDVLQTVRQHLLTPKGLRSLSPQNPLFETSQRDNLSAQEVANKNGAVWVWPLMFYVKSGLRVGGKDFADEVKQILAQFEDQMQTGCIGSLAEYYDPYPPYAAKGATSQAWSVATVLQINQMLEKQSKRRAVKPAAAKPATLKAAAKSGVKSGVKTSTAAKESKNR